MSANKDTATSPLQEILAEAKKVGLLKMLGRLIKGILFALSFKTPKRADNLPEADFMIIVPFGGFDPKESPLANKSNLDLAAGANNLYVAYVREHREHLPVYSQWEFSGEYVYHPLWGRLAFKYGNVGDFHIQTFDLLKKCVEAYWLNHQEINPKKYTPRVYLAAEWHHYPRCYKMLKKLGCTIIVNDALRPVSKHADSRQAWCRHQLVPVPGPTKLLDPHAPCGFFYFERRARILAALRGQI